MGRIEEEPSKDPFIPLVVPPPGDAGPAAEAKAAIHSGHRAEAVGGGGDLT
jgi:hypothetical protein